MKYLLITFIISMGVVAGNAMADDHCALPYEVFEASVPHTDIEECPKTLAGENRFCRYSVLAEVATIFVFDENENCLIKTKSFDDEKFRIRFMD